MHFCAVLISKQRKQIKYWFQVLEKKIENIVFLMRDEFNKFKIYLT